MGKYFKFAYCNRILVEQHMKEKRYSQYLQPKGDMCYSYMLKLKHSILDTVKQNNQK